MSEQKSPNGRRGYRQRGFTLVEFGIVMIVTGLMISSLLSAYSSYLKRARMETTYNRIFEINDIIADSWRLENRYFCPADPTLKPSDAHYGEEDCAGMQDKDPALTIMPSCTHGTNGVCIAVGLDVKDRSRNVLIGMVPFKSIAAAYNARKSKLYSDLEAATDPAMKEEIRQAIDRAKKVYSLSMSDLAVDGWGNRLTYMVSAAWIHKLDDQVSKTWTDPDDASKQPDYKVQDIQATLRSNGAIQVQDAQGKNLTKEGVRFALISHGENGSGAYNSTGGMVGGGCQGSISATEKNNCDNDALIVRTPLNTSNTDLKNDDIVAYNIYSSDDLWERVACGTSVCLRNKNSANVAIGNPTSISEKLTVAGLVRASLVNTNAAEAIAEATLCDDATHCVSPHFIGGAATEADCAKLNGALGLDKKYVVRKIGSNEIKDSEGNVKKIIPQFVCDTVDLKQVYDQRCPEGQVFRGFEQDPNAPAGTLKVKAVCYDPCAVNPPVSLKDMACPSGMSGTQTYTSNYSCKDHAYPPYSAPNTCVLDPVNGKCGSSNGRTMNTSPDDNFCDIGQVSAVTSTTAGWTWQCIGDNGGVTASCSASRRISGMCGDSNGGVYTATPTTGLCRMGNPSGVSGSGPWTWTCDGSNGGNTAHCSASKQDDSATSCGGSAATFTFPGDSETRDPVGPGCADDKLVQISNTYEIRDTGGPGSNLHEVWRVYSSSYTETGCGDHPGTPVVDNTPTKVQDSFYGTFVSGTHQALPYSGTNGQNVEYYGDQYVVSYQECSLVNGVCGTANGTGYTSAPQGNSLCSSGTATAISGTGPWTWTCKGQSGGADSPTCTAKVMTHGVCGVANSGNYTTQPANSDLCSSGNVQGTASNAGGWTWSCAGVNGGQTASCAAYKTSDGVCGSANGTTVASQPNSSSLCAAGTASNVTGGGPWNWSCSGTNGGTNANCSANKATTVNGGCGSANGGTLTSAPADSTLCASGTASAISGTGPWTWTCYGYGMPVGSNASCSASKQAPINGSCGGSNNTCGAGSSPTGYSAGSCGGAATWNCVGQYGGSTASCSNANAACPQNASCGGGNNTCNIGNATGYSAGSCGESATWTCTGINGGSNASCSNANPACAVNGSCGSSVMTCGAGSAANDGGQTACGTNRTWQCVGANGGSTANCSKANAACPTPVAGSCGSSVMTCNAGNAISDGGQTSCGTSHTWQCQGLNGGSTASCSKANAACPTPVNGSCGSSGGCNSGTASGDNGATSCGTTRTWTCNGSNGGSSASCSQANAACAVPVNGACGSTKGTCSSGTVSGDNGDNTCDSTRMWSCVGSNGGSTASCAIDNIACGGGGGGGCFTGQTKFLMADGTYKEVSELKVGDKVKGQTGVNTLERNDSFRVRSLLYRVNGSEAYVTANHPFYTKDGWKAVDYELARKEHPGMEITELKVGDVLVDEQGNEVVLKTLEPEDHGWNTVYNPSFNGDHTYYAHGYLMHNILYQQKQKQ